MHSRINAPSRDQTFTLYTYRTDWTAAPFRALVFLPRTTAAHARQIPGP